MTFDAGRKLQEAMALHQQGQFDSAKRIYQEVLLQQPLNTDAIHFLGLVCYHQKDYAQALRLMKQSLELCSTNPVYFANCGMVHKALGDFAQAVACYDQAIELDPRSARSYTNKGNALEAMGLFTEALVEHDKSLQYDPTLAETYNNRGGVLQALRRFDEALTSYQRAIEINPLYSEAYLNRGLALKNLGQNNLAMEYFNRALQLSPKNTRGLHARADICFEGGFLNEALKDYEKIQELEPEAEGILGNVMFVQRRLCVWDKFAENYAKLEHKVCIENQRTIPWAFLSYTDSLRVLQQVNLLEATAFSREAEAQAKDLVPLPSPVAKSKIRVAYCSPDFKQHPVGYLVVGLLEAHHRDDFELIGVSLGPPVKDDMRTRLQSCFDCFIDAHTLTDLEVANLLRREQVDILVDLAGWTTNSRMGIFARRGAPIQVNFLGYASTTGLATMDYIVGDAVVIPPESEKFYTEKVVRLPSYMPRDEKRLPSARKFRREKEGLPYRGFVFCCFNNSYKFSAEVFDSWSRILLAVPHSTLWLSAQSEAVVKNLTLEMVKRGVASSRLVFSPRLESVDDHLARQKCADLFLDTFPYNAHTTASDALWVGLLVLTRMGESFASRVAGSLLSSLGLTELITHSLAEYEARAIELATQPKKMQALKNKLAEQREQSTLFKMSVFARRFEQAFRIMHARWLAGQLPDKIEITD